MYQMSYLSLHLLAQWPVSPHRQQASDLRFDSVGTGIAEGGGGCTNTNGGGGGSGEIDNSAGGCRRYRSYCARHGVEGLIGEAILFEVGGKFIPTFYIFFTGAILA